jgi:hypothetical protein
MRVLFVLFVIAVMGVLVWVIGKKNESLGGCFFVLCVLLLILGSIMISSIEGKGVFYDQGETVYKASLLPVHTPDDGVYLEIRHDSYGGKTYCFKDTEEDLLVREECQCQVDYHDEELEPYCECVSTKPKAWSKFIFKPDDKRLQPHYILHVQSCHVNDIPCDDYPCDAPY